MRHETENYSRFLSFVCRSSYVDREQPTHSPNGTRADNLAFVYCIDHMRLHHCRSNLRRMEKEMNEFTIEYDGKYHIFMNGSPFLTFESEKVRDDQLFAVEAALNAIEKRKNGLSSFVNPLSATPDILQPRNWMAFTVKALIMNDRTYRIYRCPWEGDIFNEPQGSPLLDAEAIKVGKILFFPLRQMKFNSR